MDSKKKILILYASAGFGHEKAARAIAEALADKNGTVTTTLMDTLIGTRGSFGERYKKSYLYLIQHSPALWGFFYYLTDIPLVYFFIRPLRRLFNAFALESLQKKILDQDPDVVVATHFMATEVVSYLKQTGRTKAVLVTVVTDYLAHAFWLADGVDRYAVASSETAQDLRRRSITEEKIMITGIPIEKKFSRPLSRSFLRERFGIPQDSFAALVTSGGAGVGTSQALIENLLGLPEPIEVLAVCGTNERLFSSMKRVAEKNARLHPFGFVDNIQELMTASDVVLGKGGGLTISESLSLGRPLILFSSLPGQETRNARCTAKQGAARIADTLSDVPRFLAEFAEKPVLLRQFTQNALNIGRPKAAEEVARLALSFIHDG